MNGNMFCGVDKENLIVRVGPDRYGEALSRRHVRPMDITGRPSKGFVIVQASGIGTEAALHQWVESSLSFARTLPPK